MANPWILHLKAFWSKNKGKMSYKKAMSEARKSYSPKGSAAEPKKKVKKRRRKK
jgi:hypothetical protein